jgi:hypothetical protein
LNLVVSADDNRFGPRKDKRRCPRCGRDKLPQAFSAKFRDPDGWCRSCRRTPLPFVSSSSSDAVEIKLGQQRIMRVRVVGGMVVLTSGRIEARQVSEVFIECATITIPFRVLPEVRAAMTRAARFQRKAATSEC